MVNFAERKETIMTFTDLFGKQYKRNPNLIDTYFNFTECNYLRNALMSQSYTEDELKILVKPLCNKLSIYDNCLLQSELEFVNKVMRKVLDEGFCQIYVNILNKTYEYLKPENIQLNRKKAEL